MVLRDWVELGGWVLRVWGLVWVLGCQRLGVGGGLGDWVGFWGWVGSGWGWGLGKAGWGWVLGLGC